MKWCTIVIQLYVILYPDFLWFMGGHKILVNWMAEWNSVIFNLIVAWHCTVWNQICCFNYIWYNYHDLRWFLLIYKTLKLKAELSLIIKLVYTEYFIATTFLP